MKSRAGAHFVGSESKATIRRLWDRELLVTKAADAGRRLSYFGLPGPNLEDLLEWRDLLGAKTGVERLRAGIHYDEDVERARRLLTNIAIYDIEDFQLLQDEVENIILYGKDVRDSTPILSDGRPASVMRFHYDLVNLDFYGGVGYLDGHDESKRVRALKKLFERQQGTSFTLLLTLNVRDGIDDELTEYLEQTKSRAVAHMTSIVDWYARRQTEERGEKAYKLKAVVPLFVQRMAESWMFCSHAYPPIAYTSARNRMVHFVFDLSNVPGNLRAFSAQSDEDLLTLPLVEARGEVLRFASKQHPGFDRARALDTLAFLPEDTRQLMFGPATMVAQSAKESHNE